MKVLSALLAAVASTIAKKEIGKLMSRPPRKALSAGPADSKPLRSAGGGDAMRVIRGRSLRVDQDRRTR